MWQRCLVLSQCVCVGVHVLLFFVKGHAGTGYRLHAIFSWKILWAAGNGILFPIYHHISRFYKMLMLHMISWHCAKEYAYKILSKRPRSGFLKLLQQALRVRPEGLGAFGVPCSSFVFMNSATHMRSESSPYGNIELDYVVVANMRFPQFYVFDDTPGLRKTYGYASIGLRICCRTALVILVLICRSVYIFVEQPSTSRLFIIPYYTFIREMCQKFGVRFYNSFLPETQGFWFAYVAVACIVAS